ncbi:MAG: RidA family protein [Candidatus Omnitrophica bacterium]|nr:RidA family protein [Candidatus Omnitrophota bacterium]
MNCREKLKAMGHALPPAPKPAGLYHPLVVSGKLAYLSGQISRDASGKVLEGKLGGELSLEQGREASKLAALNALSILEHLLGMDKISRLVKVSGFVQTMPDFYQIPDVLNAASEVFADVLGEKGAHARTAVGVASLPLNAAVEIELVVELI